MLSSNTANTNENKRKPDEEMSLENEHIDKKPRKDPLIILNELFETANNLLLQDEDQALEVYTKIINLDPKPYVQSEFNPKLAEAYLQRGIIYFHNDQLEEAKVNFSQSIGIFPNRDAYEARGNIHYDQDIYEAAIEDYTKALNFTPANNGRYYDRGLCYYQLNKFEQAIADFTHIILLTPAASKYLARGEAYLKLKKYDQAIDDFLQAQNFELQPEPEPGTVLDHHIDTEAYVKNTLADIYILRGKEFKKNNKLQDAIKDFKSACALTTKQSYKELLEKTENLLLTLQLASRENDVKAREDLIKSNTEEENINFLSKTSAKLNELINCNMTFEQAQAYLDLSKYGEWIFHGRQIIDKYAIHTNIFFYISSFLIKTSCPDTELIADRLFKRIYAKQIQENFNKFNIGFFNFRGYVAVCDKTNNNYSQRLLIDNGGNREETEKVLVVRPT